MPVGGAASTLRISERNQAGLSDLVQVNGRTVDQQSPPRFTPSLTSTLPKDSSDAGEYFDANARARRRHSTSSSDSGTEADDESGGLLKGLPAPPVKLRKGLKDASGTPSPLLTPSYLDDDSRRLALAWQTRRRKSLQSPVCTDEETLQIRDKFTKRRRAELLRRVTETILLGFVGGIACGSEFKSILEVWSKEILAYSSVIVGIYSLYPLRLLFHHRVCNSKEEGYRHSIHIPAAFDPAPLLYPVLMAVFVAWSLESANPGVLLANLGLAISSVPRRIIPLHDNYPSYSSMHWLLSIVPLGVSELWTSKSGQNYSNRTDLTFLFPLHQALLLTLGYLTKTSLLPAELELLSISMINLLLFSTSPQALILKALLWVGGFSMFVLCGTILKRGVALARVPSWRFRHPYGRSRGGFVIFFAIDDYFKRLRNWGPTPARVGASDSDEPNVVSFQNPQKKRVEKQSLWNRKQGANNTDFPPTVLPPAAQVDRQNGSTNETLSTFQTQFKTQRRHTLPSYVGSPPHSPSQGKSKEYQGTLFPLTKPGSFLSLTKAQAISVKWLYAIYVYIVVLVIIATLVRIAVSRWALRGREPVGWALGYLLGDLPLFKSYTVRLGLEHWIYLPPYNESPQTLLSSLMAEGIQYGRIGAANTRLSICLYYLIIITTGLSIVLHLRATVEVDTRRKVFHFMMVAMFLPTIFIDPPFASLALILVLSIFLLLDCFRASQLPPISRPLTHFLAPYVDGRDHRGPVIVSHIFLLIGCAIPLWLSLAAIERTGDPPWEGWDVSKRELSMVSGVICVGMGDAAASLVGRRYGRTRWPWSGGKSLEGSFAFALAVVFGLALARMWLLLGGWAGDSGDSWLLTLGKATVAATGSSLTEAVLTGGNDNVVVPIILWLLVRGLGV